MTAGLLGSCNVFDARSGDLECSTTSDCTRDRICESGYCVVAGAQPDADPNAPDADPNAPDADTTDASTNPPDAGVTTDGGIIDCWNAAWTRRSRLVFQNSGQAGLSAFPVLVKLNSGNIDYSQTQNSGQDLRFVDRDGTLLSHEVEFWNESGDSFVWLKVPQIDGGSNTDFVYMLYGNNVAPNAQNKPAVWSSNYQGVWHLNESSGAHLDSANSISCAWGGNGFGTQNAAGIFAGADHFDDTNVNCGADVVPNTVGSTITAWVRMSLSGDTNQTVVSLDSTAGTQPGIGLSVKRMGGSIGTLHNEAYIYGVSPSSAVPANTWTYVAIRATQAASGGSIEVSKNGGAWESIASGDTSNLEIVAGTSLLFGEVGGSGNVSGLLGNIDEVRISGVSRNDDWITAQYLSMNNTFINFTSDPQVCR